MKKNIAVIFGGESTEHDISILTGIQVANALDKQKYNLIPIYIDQKGNWFYGNELLNIKFYANFNQKKVKKVVILPTNSHLFIEKFGKYKEFMNLDCAILACHGKNGEDGTLQGLLELSHIPYSSSGVFASSVGLNKVKMKELFFANKIPICKYQVVEKFEFEKNKFEFENLIFPVIVKPCNLGSSIGISVCQNQYELKKALELAFLFDDVAIIEECIKNLKEVNISVLGNKQDAICSVTEQPISKGLLSFEKKYMSTRSKSSNCGTKTQKEFSGTKNGMQNIDRIVPADITKNQEKRIKDLALKIFEITNSKGVVRIDFMIDNDTGKVYANEINTIPGSFAFYLWQKSGINFEKLLDKVIEIAIDDKNKKENLTTIFNSSVLNQTTICK